jgi:L-threonylcarbamoyladenylate synthase
MDNEAMQTLRLFANPAHVDAPLSQQALEQAAAILRHGGTVAFPTETVYGLGADALNADAVAAIFAAKQRPKWDPLIVHICDEQMLANLVTAIPEAAQRLMRAFWPGPLTLLLPRSSAVPDAVTAGRLLVGVRMPGHPVALELIRRAGVPIAAPSANRFGHTSPTTAGHVLDDLDGRIGAVLDAGPTAFGLESTVLDPTIAPMIIYRPGAIGVEQIRQIAGPAELFAEASALTAEPPEALPSPGVGLRHYAPRARLILLDPDEPRDQAGLASADLTAWLHRQASAFQQDRVGLMLPAGMPGTLGALTLEDDFAAIFCWGNWSDLEEMAHRLFAGLRHLDALGCSVIVCPVPAARGIGVAIRDRLRKAASRKLDEPEDEARRG